MSVVVVVFVAVMVVVFITSYCFVFCFLCYGCCSCNILVVVFNDVLLLILDQTIMKKRHHLISSRRLKNAAKQNRQHAVKKYSSYRRVSNLLFSKGGNDLPLRVGLKRGGMQRDFIRTIGLGSIVYCMVI